MSVVTARPARLPSAVHAIVVVLLCCSPGAAWADGESDPAGVWPLAPAHQVVRGFEPPSTTWSAGHRGVDLAGHVGQQVHASVAGLVTFVGSIGGKPVVVVDLGVMRTTYEPVLPVVRVGDRVQTGQVIGTLSALFSHCAPAACLHWGLIRDADDVYLDPLVLVGRVQVRLLPLWREAPGSGGQLSASGGGAPLPGRESEQLPPAALVRASSPGVRLLERPAQPVGTHVRVELGGGQRRVPEELLY